MSGTHWTGLVIVAALFLYLLFALLRPEKF